MRPVIDFRPYRATPETLWRPARDGPFEPEYAVPAATFDDLRAIERADERLRSHAIDPVRQRRLVEEALARNAFGTASIEGNPLTEEEVESLLARQPTPDAAVLPDEREILRYADFVARLDAWPVPRPAADVLSLHRALFDGILHDAGAFKERANFIGRRPQYEVVYVPSAPERVVPELDGALAWLHDAHEHPLIKNAIFFHELQAIHPFRDGNGRVGRALSTRLLHHFGYHGVRYALVDHRFNADREAYYGTLAEVERNGWDFTPWVVYMTRVLRETFEDALRRALFQRRLPLELTARQARIAEWFVGAKRAKFADVHAAFPTVAPRTLKRELATLRDAGVLALDGVRKGSVWRGADEYFD